jgi:hypothetical protein
MKNDHLTQAADEGRTVKLPELPEPVWELTMTNPVKRSKAWYEAEHMRAYGLACFRSGMERAAEIAEGMDCAHRCAVGGEVAAAIRKETNGTE